MTEEHVGGSTILDPRARGPASPRSASPVPASASVSVLWKSFDSERSWASVPASRSPDGRYTASVSGDASGALFAVEISAGQGAWRYPDALSATPYVSLAPSSAGP